MRIFIVDKLRCEFNHLICYFLIKQLSFFFYSLIQKISNKKVKIIDVNNISVFWWDIIISFSKKIK